MTKKQTSKSPKKTSPKKSGVQDKKIQKQNSKPKLESKRDNSFVKPQVKPKRANSHIKPKTKQTQRNDVRSTNQIDNSKSTVPSTSEEARVKPSPKSQRKNDEEILFGKQAPQKQEKLKFKKVESPEETKIKPPRGTQPSQPTKSPQQNAKQFNTQAKPSMPYSRRSIDMVKNSDTQFQHPQQSVNNKSSASKEMDSSFTFGLNRTSNQQIKYQQVRRTSNQSATKNFIYERYLISQKQQRVSVTPQKKVSWYDQNQVIEYNQDQRDSKSHSPYRPMTTIQSPRPQLNFQNQGKKEASQNANKKARTTTQIQFHEEQEEQDAPQTSAAGPIQLGQKRTGMVKSKSCGKKTDTSNLLSQPEQKPPNKRQQKAESKAKQPKKANLFDEAFLSQFKQQMDQLIKTHIQKTGDETLFQQYEKETKAYISKLSKLKHKTSKV